MKTSRFFFKVAGGVLILMFISIGAAVLTGSVGRPILWEFSPRYRGWVVVEYERPECPPLLTKAMHLVIDVPPSGHACTSSPIPKGWRYERYEYVLPDGRRKVIRSSGWDRNSEITSLSVNAEKKTEFLFVGTREELSKNWSSRPDK
jgi:hypothetical protein